MAKLDIRRFTVVPDGDIELWTVAGKLADGFDWTIALKLKPYLTTPKPGELPQRYYFKPVEHWSNAIQYEVLCDVLDRFDHSPQDERGWWFSHETLLKFAKKAPGITPEFYERWPTRKLLYDEEESQISNLESQISNLKSQAETVESEYKIPFTKQELKFLKHLQSLTGETSWAGMKILWLTMRKAAIKWLAEDRKTLDLGFARLIPVPYRANWKEALAVRFAPFLSKFRRKWARSEISDLKSQILDNPTDPLPQFQAALSSVKLLAWDKQNHFAHWSVETLLSAELERRLDEEEYARWQKLGHSTYARHLLGQLAERMTEVTAIFWRYVDKVLLPPAKLVDSMRGATKLVPEVKPGAVHPMKGITKRLDLVPAKAFERWTDEEISDLKSQISNFLPKPPAFLQDVPAMQNAPNGTAAVSVVPSRMEMVEIRTKTALERVEDRELGSGEPDA